MIDVKKYWYRYILSSSLVIEFDERTISIDHYFERINISNPIHCIIRGVLILIIDLFFRHLYFISLIMSL